MQNLAIDNHLDFQDLRALEASEKAILCINANTNFITILIDVILFNPTRIEIF